MEILLTILGALLPWLLIVGTPVVLLVLWLRRSARNRAGPSTVVTPVPQPAVVAPTPQPPDADAPR